MSADPMPPSLPARPPTAAVKPSWSKAALSVWGKSSGYDSADRMPLVQHLLDSAEGLSR